ncbi:hypothetical protein E2C01_096945 [Portunus trituberculatus]|uniref:Uncharacterized protein n=1 Tax=Portunus trituberculatus TaxID=210409 RepID=A0A5B7K874_PORTR|nr:hypothetical protein [Portunus trituberculatus]
MRRWRERKELGEVEVGMSPYLTLGECYRHISSTRGRESKVMKGRSGKRKGGEAVREPRKNGERENEDQEEEEKEEWDE